MLTTATWGSIHLQWCAQHCLHLIVWFPNEDNNGEWGELIVSWHSKRHLHPGGVEPARLLCHRWLAGLSKKTALTQLRTQEHLRRAHHLLWVQQKGNEKGKGLITNDAHPSKNHSKVPSGLCSSGGYSHMIHSSISSPRRTDQEK